VQDDDFWLLLEPSAESFFSISRFRDDSKQLLLNLQLDQKINNNLHVNAAWSQLDIEENIHSRSLGFSGDPYQSWLWFYTFNRWGKPGLVTSQHHELRLQFFQQQWNGLIGLQRGDLRLNFVRNLRNGQNTLGSDHQAIIIGWGYNQPNFYWQFENIQHQYQKDLTQLTSNRFLLSIIEPSALQQTNSLTKSSSQLTLGFKLKHYSIDTQLGHIKSALTHDSSEFISVSVSRWFANNYQLGLHLTQPLQTGSQSLGLSLTTQW